MSCQLHQPYTSTMSYVIHVCVTQLMLCALQSAAYDIRYTDDAVSLSPFPIDVGRNVFYSRQGWPDNAYFDTYSEDPDVGRTTEEYITSRGFTCVTYHVTTRDGYILPMYRIVNPFNKNKKSYPVLIGTSLFLDANQWIWNYGGSAVPPKDPDSVKPGQILNSNLPYALSNHGYDVWLFNPRGVGGDLAHENYSIYSSDYWKFSLDEVVANDMPTVIEFVLSTTKYKKLGYIGYSEGSTFGLLLMATQARYNEILKPVILMAFGLVSSKNTSVSSTDVLFAATLSQVALPLFPKLKLTSTVLTAVCSPPVQDVCAYILGYITGYDNANFNKTRFPVYLSQSPAGTSSWIFAQYSHNNNVHCFSYFNSNPVDNKRKYGTETAPCYNMTRVTNRFISAYIGQNDQRSPYSDYALSLLGVNPVFERYVIPYANWSHADYVVGKSIGRYIVPKVIMSIQRALSKS